MATATKRARRTRLIVSLAFAALAGCYALGYGVVRSSHRLVRYESGCVARGHLDGRDRDLWDWPYRCWELRRSLEPAQGPEVVFAPFITLEELVRDPHRRRESVCSLPIGPPGIPSQGMFRPAWCSP